jgi:hypothetical protein
VLHDERRHDVVIHRRAWCIRGKKPECAVYPGRTLRTWNGIKHAKMSGLLELDVFCIGWTTDREKTIYCTVTISYSYAWEKIVERRLVRSWAWGPQLPPLAAETIIFAESVMKLMLNALYVCLRVSVMTAISRRWRCLCEMMSRYGVWIGAGAWESGPCAG